MAATINNHDSSDNSVDVVGGHRDEPVSPLVHSLAKRSPIFNPFFPIKFPLVFKKVVIADTLLTTNPALLPLQPGLQVKLNLALLKSLVGK